MTLVRHLHFDVCHLHRDLHLYRDHRRGFRRECHDRFVRHRKTLQERSTTRGTLVTHLPLSFAVQRTAHVLFENQVTGSHR